MLVAKNCITSNVKISTHNKTREKGGAMFPALTFNRKERYVYEIFTIYSVCIDWISWNYIVSVNV